MISYRPERADELVGLATPADEQMRWLERLEFETRDGEVVAPTFRARDVTREVDVVEEVARLAARGGSLHAPDPAGDVRRADADPAAPAPCREHARRPRSRRDVHALAAAGRPESEGVEARRADLGRALDPAHAPPAEPRRRGAAQRRARRRGRSRCSRWRASTCPTASFPTSTRTSAGSSRAAGTGRRASSRRSTRALKAEPVFERDDRRPAPSRARRPRSARASSASCIRRCSTASGASSSSTSASCSRRRGTTCATRT